MDKEKTHKAVYFAFLKTIKATGLTEFKKSTIFVRANVEYSEAKKDIAA